LYIDGWYEKYNWMVARFSQPFYLKIKRKLYRASMKNIFKFISFLSLMLLSSHSVAAWDGTLLGKINSIDVAPGQNYGFRISLVGFPKICGNDNTWAYLNESDSNYNTYVSVLLAAKMADKNVVVYTKRETSSGHNYCHIGYISLK